MISAAASSAPETKDRDDRKAYWASVQNPKRLIARCLERIAWHQSALRSTGRLDKMVRMMTAYYGRGTDGQRDTTSLLDGGEQGEVTELHTNVIRPVVQNTLSIIAGTRPAVKPVATNGDAVAAAETRLALGLHEYYDRKISAKTLEIECVRGGLIASGWWLVQGWAPKRGEPVAFDETTGQISYEGDIELFTVPPWRMASDLAPNEAERRWVLFRRRMPVHDLAATAKDPEIQRKLLNGTSGANAAAYANSILAKATSSLTAALDSLLGEDFRAEDDVWVYELRHRPCPALPLGRLVRFVEPDIILWDSMAAGEPEPLAEGQDELVPKPVKYPYDEAELHAYEWCPERIVGTAHGHTPMSDLMGLQDFHDLCTASIASSVNLNGTQHLWSGGDAAPNVHRLDSGPTVLESPTKPEVLDFAALKPEVVQAAEWARTLMNQSAALNDTVMGNPEKGMPASAQALQRAQAVQYHQVSQDEWVRLIEKNANGRLRLLKRFARVERVAEIAGAGGAWEVQKWKADDIAGVERFQVEPINPMSATFEGRQAIAEQMGVQGDALLDFITTGSLKKVTETRTNQLELVEQNKALLLKGIGLAPVDMAASQQQGQPVFTQPPPGPDGEPPQCVSILRSDPHHLAIPAYLSVVNSPQSRAEPTLITAALDCVTESLRLWMTLSPDECAAFGIPPLPSTAQVPMMPPGAAPGSGLASGVPQPPPKPQGVPGEQPPGLPEPPRDPINGEAQKPNLALTRSA